MNSKARTFRETMVVGDELIIDPQFPRNEHIEVGVAGPDGGLVGPDQGVVVTGLMVRILDRDPADLIESEWWPAWAKSLRVDLHASEYYRAV